MDINTAKAAGVIAADIEALQAMMAIVQRAIDANWQVSALRAVDPVSGEDTTLLASSPISADNSQAGYGFIQSIYRAQLAALQAQLAALA